MDDLRQQLARVFAAEQAEHVAAMRAGLDDPDAADLRELFRRAHSLKGAARAVDAREIEALAHALEALLEQAEAAGRLGTAQAADARGLIDAIEDAGRPAGAPVHEAGQPEPEEDRDAFVRVSARHLDALIGSLRLLRDELDGRAALAASFDGTRAEIEAIRQACAAPDATLAGISGRLGRLHAASLAVATRRSLAETQVARKTARVEADAERILLAPAVGVAAGLERMVRDVAADAGKAARLVVADDGAEADRRLLQALRDPLTQILRNAVGHGIEVPAARAAAGKPAEGLVRLDIRAARGELRITVEDDGAGPDVAAIRRAAAVRGVASAQAPLADEAALALAFEHGVSTASEADRLSGRGVGLAVVADAVRRHNGSVRLLRAPGGGARIVLAVPLAITRRPVVVVEAGGQSFALPASGVARLLRIGAEEVAPVRGVPTARIATTDGERAVPIVPLAAVLGLPGGPAADPVPAVLVERDGAAVLLAVDGLVTVQAVAVGNPAALLVELPLVLGTAALGDGVALVLSIDALFGQLARHGPDQAARPSLFPEPERRATILIVDDSITTRTLERGILEGQGYRVLVAVDGIDALERLRTPGVAVDLMVADVEMPRMDGFGLLAAIRNDDRLARIPVVMMTSRDAPDDIQRGLDLGADAYVTKQSFEQGALLATVRRLI